jgi:hypothetical protein
VSEDYKDSINALESGVFTFSGHLLFRHQLTERLELSWGIGYPDLGYNSKAEIVILPNGTPEFLNMTFRQGFCNFQ